MIKHLLFLLKNKIKYPSFDLTFCVSNEYCTILRYQLMIPLFLIDEVCPICRKACLNTFGEHVVHCKELLRFKYRYEFFRDVLFDIFWKAGVLVKKEAPTNFLTDPLDRRSTLRPADVDVWMDRRRTCMCELE